MSYFRLNDSISGYIRIDLRPFILSTDEEYCDWSVAYITDLFMYINAICEYLFLCLSIVNVMKQKLIIFGDTGESFEDHLYIPIQWYVSIEVRNHTHWIG